MRRRRRAREFLNPEEAHEVVLMYPWSSAASGVEEVSLEVLQFSASYLYFFALRLLRLSLCGNNGRGASEAPQPRLGCASEAPQMPLRRLRYLRHASESTHHNCPKTKLRASGESP